MSDAVSRFFQYARLREAIRLGTPVEDEILKTYRFCNVFREDDRTTTWFRESLREPRADEWDVMFTTLMFRWFNRIGTAELLLERYGPQMFTLNYFRPDLVRKTLADVRPIINPAYIIKTPNGMNKLDGIIWCLENFSERRRRELVAFLNGWNVRPLKERRLQDIHEFLTRFPYMGPFMAYEVVTDLRHTWMAETAPDIMTWANAGPGAFRGLSRVAGRRVTDLVHPEQANEEMQNLLHRSLDPELWPADWRPWEMREVEHTLCEFDKYERARLGEGRPKQLYRKGK